MKNRFHCLNNLLLSALVAGTMQLGSGQLLADRTWSGATDATWATTTNWSGSVVPGTTDLAVFAAPSSNNSNVLGADQSVLGLVILSPTSTITIAGDNTLTTGTSGINMSAATQNLTISAALALGGDQTWNVASGRTLTITGTTGLNAGAYNLTLNGLGTFRFSPTSTFTAPVGSGTMTLNGGTLNLANGNVVGLTNIIGASTNLVLNGGTVSVTQAGSDVGTTTQNLASVTINTGAASFTQARVSNSSIRENLGVLARGAGAAGIGGTVNFIPTSNPGSNAIFTTTATNVNGIIGGWATYNSTDFAVSRGGALHLGTPTYASNTWVSGTNTTVTLAANTIADGSTTNSLRFAQVASDTLTLAGTATIGSGGLLMSSAVTAGNNNLITGGTLKGASGADLIVHQFGAGTLSIGSVIADNGSATALTKVGSGTLVILGTSNSYTGTTYVHAGTLQLGNGTTDGSIPNGSNIVNSAALAYKLAGTQSYSGVISGTGTLTKLGVGTMTLTGANTYTGRTTVNVGTLKLDFSAGGAPTNNIIASSSPLSLGGGILNVVGNASTSGTQSFASTSVASGGSVVSAAPASGATISTVSLGAITPSVGATVQFVGPATVTGTTNTAATATITTTTAGGGTLGELGTFGVTSVGAYSTVGLYDWASTSLTTGSAGSSPYTIIGGSQVTGFYQTTGITTGGNYDVTSGATNTLGNATGSQTIRFNKPTQLAVSFSATTANGIQGILVTPNIGSNNISISGGGLEFVRSTSGGNAYGVIWQNNTSGYLNFSSAINGGRQAGQNNGLVQAGPGTVVYTGVNDYENPTYLNGGYSVISANSGFGRQSNGSTVNLNGGTIVGNATFTLDNSGSNARPIALGANGGGLAATGTNIMTVSGVVSGAAGTGSLTIGIPASSANGNTVGLLPGSGPGTANTTAVNATGMVALTGANTYLGGTVLTTGTLQINGINALGGGNYGGLTFNGGSLQYAAGFSGNGSGDISIPGAGVLTPGGGAVTFASGMATIDTNGNAVTYSQTIGNGGSGSLIKTGAGTLSLAAANNYTGNTFVNGGTLAANNATGSATGSGSVTVNNGGTLGGTGIITTAVTVNSGGVLAPGNSVGTLTLGSLTLSGSSILNYEFNTNPANDLTVVTANNGLTLNGGGFNLYNENLITPFSTPGTYNLIAYTGTFNGTGLGAFSVLNQQPARGYSFGTVTISGTNFVTLSIASLGNSATWNIDAGGSWATQATGTTNWDSGAVPNAQGDAANFGTVITAPVTVTLDGDKTVSAVTFTNTNSYIIASGTGGTLHLSSTATALISDIQGSHEIQVPVSLDQNTTASVVAGSTLTMSGAVSGTGALTKSGTGTLALSGSNSYSGGTAFIAGTLEIGASSALGTGSVAVTGANTLRSGTAGLVVANGVSIASGLTTTVDTQANTMTLSGQITETGSSAALTKIGSGTLILTNSNTYTGVTNITNGTLQLGSGGADGSVAGNITNSGALILNRSADASITSLVSGTGTLNQAGSNIATLAAANTFTGGTVISGGTLALGNNLALQNSTLDYNNQGGTLIFNTTAATLGGLTGAQSLALTNTGAAAVTLSVGNNGTTTGYSGSLSGNGALTKVGAGTFTLTGSNSYSGATLVTGGILSIDTGGSIATTSASSNDSGGGIRVDGGSLTASAFSSVGNSTAFSGVSFRLISGTATFNGGIQTSNGDGRLISVAGGLFTASSVTLQRTANPGAPGANGVKTTIPTDSGFYVSGGTANISGNLSIATSNSAATARIDGGDVTVGGTVLIGKESNNRWNYMQVNGGTFTSTDTTNGIVIGQGGSSIQSELYLTGGVTTAERIGFGVATDTVGGTSNLSLNGGTLYVGSGGLVTSNTTGLLTTNVYLITGTVGAKADWSSAMNMSLVTNPTFQAADVSGTAHNITLSGVLSGTAGGFTKTGLGTLTLQGTNTYGGLTSVNEGTLKFDVSETLTGGLNVATSGTAVLTAHGVGGVKVLDISSLTISGTAAFAGGGAKLDNGAGNGFTTGFAAGAGSLSGAGLDGASLASPAPVPEPAAWVSFLIGTFFIVFFLKSKKTVDTFARNH